MRSSSVVAEAGCSGIGVSPRPEEPVITASTSESPAPAPAWMTTGASRGVRLTVLNGAGKDAPRGRIWMPLRDTSSRQPPATTQLCMKPEPALRTVRSST